ncbi:MAG: hypothetical protein Q8K63_10685, partial [Acidimicrobiales bacterium]|nr:hypothetical protein [Acidimicrobiales bacterium]
TDVDGESFDDDFSDEGSGFDDEAAFDDTDGDGDIDESDGAGRDVGRAPRVLASTANDFGDRAGFLYLTLMFAVLGLCIAPRLALPARLPGPKE